MTGLPRGAVACDDQGVVASLGGRLLVASPLLLDPNFERAVVLICAHHEDGTLGLVLNRPLRTPLPAALPEWRVEAWQAEVAPPATLFAGGPVAPTSALGLARRAPGSPEPAGWSAVTPELGFIDLRPLHEQPRGGPRTLSALRVFAGHAGWGADQLETELAEGAWYVLDVDRGDAFSADPAGLWSRVLRRQGGELTLLASYPRDPSLN